jgi:hypothetical protein
MKIIISESQLRQIIESEKQSKFKKSLEQYMDLYDGDVNSASESSGIELYKFIEMGFVESYDEDLWLDLQNTPIKSLGNLKYVDGDLLLSNTSIKSLGNLEKVDGFLNLENTPIESLGDLKKVSGGLNLFNSSIKSLGNLEKVGGYLDLANTPIESLGNLWYVGDSLNLEGCPLAKLSDEEIKSQVKIKKGIFR